MCVEGGHLTEILSLSYPWDVFSLSERVDKPSKSKLKSKEKFSILGGGGKGGSQSVTTKVLLLEYNIPSFL